MESKNLGVGEGYFSNRIRKYMAEHHPDRMERGDAEKQVEAMTEEAIQLFLSYDQAGMPTYESLERALVETLESISTPYTSLEEFIEKQASTETFRDEQI